MYDVIGISNPLVDVCVEINDNFLERHNLKKGHFTLVEPETFKKIHDNIDKKDIKIEFGGSVANTLAGLNLLGCKVAEFGKIGKDEYGAMLKKEKEDKQIGNYLSEHHYPTGTVLCLISPDSERTFAVCLGAASELDHEDIDENIIKDTKILHLTGYEFESPSVRRAIRKAADIAKENGVKISMDLADPGVVQRTFIDLKAFVESYVDILFANEEEALEFTGKPVEEAVEALSKIVDYAIVKIGDKGSFIKVAHKGSTYKIKAKKVRAKDTTGAGDMYAAAILYSIINNLPMDEAGKIASYASAQVVKKIGARLDKLDISKVK